MKRKIIIVVVITGLLLIGIRAWYFKDYVTVLKYDNSNSRVFVSSDSITISPYFYVENEATLGAVIDFESLTGSLLLEDLNVTVYSTDNPNQSIQLRNVSAVIHPVTGSSGGNLDCLEAVNFKDLPASSKTITYSGLPYNKIDFFFITAEIGRTSYYNFKINGKLVYKGKTYYFEKEIKTERKLEYQPYRMMTWQRNQSSGRPNITAAPGAKTKNRNSI